MSPILHLPGLVDVHTHLRVPGGEHKEDFASGTAAALAGGFTQILAMPNTSPPLATLDVLQAARAIASETVRCDVGLYAGASPQHVEDLPALALHAVALKIIRAGRPGRAVSLPLGALRLSDLFLGFDEAKPAAVARLNEFVAEHLAPVDWFKAQPGDCLVALGGTMRNLARISNASAC